MVRPEASSVAICRVARLNSAGETARAHASAPARARYLAVIEGNRPVRAIAIAPARGVGLHPPDTVRPAASSGLNWNASITGSSEVMLLISAQRRGRGGRGGKTNNEEKKTEVKNG